MSYNELVLRLFFNPEHAAILESDNHYKEARFVDSSQFQQIDFYVDCHSKSGVYKVAYRVKGNPYMIAGAEWMAQAVEKHQDGAILRDMTPHFWHGLFAIPPLEKRTAVGLSQAANVLYDLIQANQ